MCIGIFDIFLLCVKSPCCITNCFSKFSHFQKRLAMQHSRLCSRNTSPSPLWAAAHCVKLLLSYVGLIPDHLIQSTVEAGEIFFRSCYLRHSCYTKKTNSLHSENQQLRKKVKVVPFSWCEFCIYRKCFGCSNMLIPYWEEYRLEKFFLHYASVTIFNTDHIGR